MVGKSLGEDFQRQAGGGEREVLGMGIRGLSPIRVWSHLANLWQRILFMVLALTLGALSAGCVPTPPRFGHYGGPVKSEPESATPAPKAANLLRETNWSPVQARFHPDGNRLVINFCHVDAPYYCRLVEYDRVRNTWKRLPGQQEGVSYTYPSYSNDGRSLVFSVVPCSPDRKQCNSGYGQLATMPAGGGPITLLPVQQARRAHFTADDKRLTYWRLKTTGKLASGRSFGSFSVYEYDLGSGQETALVESMETTPGRPFATATTLGRSFGLSFIADTTAPRYLSDGKTLYFCAMNGDTWMTDSTGLNNLVHPVPGWGTNCIFFDVTKQTYKLVDTDRLGRTDGNIGTPYVQHKARGILTGSYLGFVDANTLTSIGGLFFKTGHHIRTDADIHPLGDTVIAVTGTTMFKNGEHIPKSTFYRMKEISPFKTQDPTNYTRSSPVLALVHADNHQVTPLEWPDIEQMPETRQP